MRWVFEICLFEPNGDSHTAGTAVVTLQSPVDDAALKKAVEDKDYKVLGIE